MALGSTTSIDPIAAGKRGGLGVEIKRNFAPRGVDIAIETSGSYSALHAAVASVGVGGRVVSVGFYQGDGTGLRLGEEWHHNRPDLISSMGVWAAHIEITRCGTVNASPTKSAIFFTMEKWQSSSCSHIELPSMMLSRL